MASILEEFAELYLSVADSRRVDEIAIQQYGFPSLLLMENAGRSCAIELLKRLPLHRSRVLICCGKGNNGGDGFVMARHLLNAGQDVEVAIFFSPESFSEDAHRQYELAVKSGISVRQFNRSAFDQSLVDSQPFDWCVDALLGTGATGDLRSPFREVVTALNRYPSPIFSIDLPTGMDADTGVVSSEAVRATVTMPLVTQKIGFRNPLSRPYLGETVVGEIGIPAALLRELARTR